MPNTSHPPAACYALAEELSIDHFSKGADGSLYTLTVTRNVQSRTCESEYRQYYSIVTSVLRSSYRICVEPCTRDSIKLALDEKRRRVLKLAISPAVPSFQLPHSTFSFPFLAYDMSTSTNLAMPTVVKRVASH